MFVAICIGLVASLVGGCFLRLSANWISSGRLLPIIKVFLAGICVLFVLPGMLVLLSISLQEFEVIQLSEKRVAYFIYMAAFSLVCWGTIIKIMPRSVTAKSKAFTE